MTLSAWRIGMADPLRGSRGIQEGGGHYFQFISSALPDLMRSHYIENLSDLTF